MKKIIQSLLLCLTTTTAYYANAEQAPAKTDNTFNGIFTFEKDAVPQPVTDGPLWAEVNDGTWHLSDAELATMQSQLRHFFEGKDGVREIQSRWQTYTIQYQGQSLSQKRYVKIEGTCMASDPKSVHKEFAVIFDGGACVFNIKYDPIKEQFFDLEINGFA